MRYHSNYNSKIHRTSRVEAGTSIINSTMGKYSFCGYECEILNCTIGSFTSIANNVKIGSDSHPVNWVSTSSVFYNSPDSIKKKFSSHRKPESKPTVIGHDVWIGANAMIKEGVNIGTGAVIGMGSVVVKDVEPYSIVVGAPAKNIRKRFDENTIEKLLKTEWWSFDDNKLAIYAQYFRDPAEFILRLEE